MRARRARQRANDLPAVPLLPDGIAQELLALHALLVPVALALGMEVMVMQTYVVSFEGCAELVLRRGECPDDVLYPDDLGCPAVSATLLDPDRIKALWRKGGEMRVELRE